MKTCRTIVTILAIGYAFAGRADRVYYVDNRHPEASDENPGTHDAPFMRIQAAVDIVQPGDTVIVREGTYREGILWKTAGRPDARITLKAAEGETVAVKGSFVITGWRQVGTREAGLAADFPGANIWVRDEWAKEKLIPEDDNFPAGHYRWPGGQYFHDNPRQAFWKDAPLEGAGRLGPAFFIHQFEEGRLFHDRTNKKLYIWLPPGIDPNENGMEVSLRPLLLRSLGPGEDGVSPFSYVTVRGIQFRHAGTRGLTNWAAVSINRAMAVEFDDNIVSWNDYVGFSLHNCQNAFVRRNVFGYNGSGGMGTGGEDTTGHLFEDNLVIANNRDNYTYFLNSGGGKVCYISNSVFRRHRAMYNNGCGLWLDIECNDNIIEDSIFAFNTGAGLDIEISRRNIVRNSIFAFNMRRPSGYEISHAGRDESQRQYAGGGGGWGLTNRQSEGTRIYHNLFYGNADGGLMILVGVRDPDNMYWTSRDVIVKNNIFADNGSWQLQFPHPEKVKEATGNVSDYNLFWGGKPIHSGEPLARWTRETGLEAHSIQERPDVPFGVDGNFELPSTSPAVDAGIYVEECPVDMRGVERPVGRAVDIGPFERASTLGREHRPVVPDNLEFTTVELAGYRQWMKNQLPGREDTVEPWPEAPEDAGYVSPDRWPTGDSGRTLAAFAEILPRGADGKPSAGEVTLSGIPFHMGYPESLLNIPPHRRGLAYIPVNRNVDWIFILHTASGVRRGTSGAFYRIRYADGDSMNITFSGEQNIADFASADPESFFDRERGTTSRVAWQGLAEDGRQVSVWCWAWPNHRPDVEVLGIQVWEQGYGADWAILGVTLGHGGGQ